MKLSDLLENVEIIENDLPLCSDFDNIDSSSEKMSGKACIFCAVAGVSKDGHEFALKAEENGAAAILAQRRTNSSLPHIIVKDTRAAYSRIYANLISNPARSIKLCGITGTNGKTSSAYMLHHILTYAGKKTALISTVQNIVGGAATPSVYTTPETKQLHNLFAEMKRCKDEYAVSEVSSHSLAQGRVEGLFYEVGAFTNLTQDHLDFHITMENYLNEKLKLMKMCRVGVINADDSHCGYFIKASEKHITYGIDNKADITAEDIKIIPQGSEFTAVFPDGKFKTSVSVKGRFSVYNALCAISCAYALGIDPETACKAMKEFGGVRGRMESYPIKEGYSLILDYAHSPDGLQNAISTLNEIKGNGRLKVLFGCGGDRDSKKRPIMGEIAETYADFAIVTSDNPRTEEPSEIIKDILKGMKKDNHIVIEDRKEAMKYAIETAEKGDIILFAGKGHEDYQILKTGKIHFDEREVIADILEKLGRR